MIIFTILVFLILGCAPASPKPDPLLLPQLREPVSDACFEELARIMGAWGPEYPANDDCAPARGRTR